MYHHLRATAHTNAHLLRLEKLGPHRPPLRSQGACHRAPPRRPDGQRPHPTMRLGERDNTRSAKHALQRRRHRSSASEDEARQAVEGIMARWAVLLQ